MKDNEYRTSDISLAGYMETFKIPLLRVEKRVGEETRKDFVFLIEDKNQLERVVEAFQQHKALVDPLDYFNALKMMKGRLHQS